MKARPSVPSLLFLAALGLYLPGLASQPLPGDVAVYLRRAHDLQLDSFAQTHSLFLFLAHLAMRLLWGVPPALAASLLAALAAATAVALTAAILRHLGVGAAGTLFGAGALAASHTMWFHAVIPEVYSLNAAAMAAMVLCALKWDKATLTGDNLRGAGGRRPLLFLAAMTFLGGLACANHMLAGITLAGCWAWVGGVTWYRWRPGHHSIGQDEPANPSPGALSLLSQGWRMAMAGLFGGLGFLPLLTLLWRDAGMLGWPTALSMALVGGRGISGEAMVSYGAAMGTLSPPQLARSATMCLAALLYNFPSPALLALPWGVGFCRRQAGGALLLGLAILHGAFAATYAIHEAWAFLLPAWMMVALAAGLGFEGLAAATTRSLARQSAQGRAIAIGIIAVTLLAPLALYAAAPALILRWVGHSTIEEKAAGRRLTAEAYLKFYLSPQKRQAQAEAEWLRQTLAALPDHANLCLRPGYRALAFYLQQVEFIRPDVKLLGHHTETLAAALQADKTVFADADNPLQRLPGRQPAPLDAELLDNGLWQIRQRR